METGTKRSYDDETATDMVVGPRAYGALCKLAAAVAVTLGLGAAGLVYLVVAAVAG